MSNKPASTVRITKTRSGATRVRATGRAAQELFNLMCKAHGIEQPAKPQEGEAQQPTERKDAQ